MSEESERPIVRSFRSRVARRLGILVGAILLVMAGAAIALKVILTPEKLRALVEPRLEAAVGREVQLGSVGLRIFPKVAIRLGDVAIANPPGFGSEPMLELDALDLQVQVRPLLRREIVLNQVRLIRPHIRYEVAADGSSNLAGLGGAKGEREPAPEEAAAGAAALGLLVGELTLRDGRVEYSDAASGRRVDFKLDARIAANPTAEGGALESRGRIDVADLRMRMSSEPADTLAVPELRIEYELLADLAGDSVNLREVTLTMGDLPARGSGVLRGLRSERTLELRLETDAIEIPRLLAALPNKSDFEGIELRGAASLSLDASGSLAGDDGLAWSGSAELTGLETDYAGIDNLLTGGSGRVTFNRERATVRSFSGQLLGKPFEAQLNVTNFENPRIVAKVKGEVDLAQLASMRDKPAPITGAASFDLRVNGPVRRLERIRIRGPIQLTDVAYASESLAEPARIASGTLQLTGAGISTEALTISLGSSELALTLTARQLLPLLLAPEDAERVPSVEFRLTSDKLDLGELATEESSLRYSTLVTARLAGRKVEGRDPAEIARERYKLPPLPPMQATGRVVIQQLINPPTNVRRLRFNVVLQDGVLELTDVKGRIYDGDLAGGLSLDFSDARPPFQLTYQLSLAGARARPFVARWTRLGEAVAGRVNFTISGSTTIDESLLPAPEAVDAEGTTTFSNGRFLDFGPANSLMDQFKLDRTVSATFQRLGGPFKIEGGAFVVDGWQLAAGALKADINGRAGLGGVLDLSLAMKVPESMLKNAGLIGGSGVLGNLLGELAGGDGTIDISLGIGGTMSSPVINLDTKALEAALQDRLQEEGKNLLDRLFKPPPD